MIARIALLGLILVTGLLLDTVVLAGLSFGSVGPSIVVLTVVAVGLADGGEAGARYGFAAGLTVDLLAGSLVGVSALVYLLTGFGVGALRPYLDGSALVTKMGVGAAASAAAVLLYGGLVLLFDPQGVEGGAVILGALVAGLGNGLLAPLVIRPVASALRRVDVTLPA